MSEESEISPADKQEQPAKPVEQSASEQRATYEVGMKVFVHKDAHEWNVFQYGTVLRLRRRDDEVHIVVVGPQDYDHQGRFNFGSVEVVHSADIIAAKDAQSRSFSQNPPEDIFAKYRASLVKGVLCAQVIGREDVITNGVIDLSKVSGFRPLDDPTIREARKEFTSHGKKQLADQLFPPDYRNPVDIQIALQSAHAEYIQWLKTAMTQSSTGEMFLSAIEKYNLPYGTLTRFSDALALRRGAPARQDSDPFARSLMEAIRKEVPVRLAYDVVVQGKELTSQDYAPVRFEGQKDASLLGWTVDKFSTPLMVIWLDPQKSPEIEQVSPDGIVVVNQESIVQI